jgi:hypothetical protein
LQDAIQILCHFLILESNNPKPKRFQISFALRVIFLLQIMNFPVHFHDQIILMAQKIGEIAVDDLLPAKMKSVQPIGFQMFPKNPLGGRHIAAQFLRAFKLPGRNRLSANDVLYWHGGNPFSSLQEMKPGECTAPLPWEGRGWGIGQINTPRILPGAFHALN